MTDDDLSDESSRDEYLIGVQDQQSRGYAAAAITELSGVEAVERIGRVTLLVEATPESIGRIRDLEWAVSVEPNDKVDLLGEDHA